MGFNSGFKGLMESKRLAIIVNSEFEYRFYFRLITTSKPYTFYVGM